MKESNPPVVVAVPSPVENKDVVTEPAAREVNSVDATAGQPIVVRVQARKSELEGLLAGLPADDKSTRADIEHALAAITTLLTGDLDNVPKVVVADMSRWLEVNKHVAARASK